MAGGLRKLGSAFIELVAPKDKLEADLAAAKEAVERQQAEIAEIHKIYAAEQDADDNERYQEKLRQYAIEAEVARRTEAAKAEAAQLAATRAKAAAAEAAATKASAGSFDVFATSIRGVTAAARGFMSIFTGVLRVLGTAGAIIGAVGVAYTVLKDAIFGSTQELAKHKEALEKSNSEYESYVDVIKRLRSEIASLKGQPIFEQSKDRADAIDDIRRLTQEIADLKQKLEEVSSAAARTDNVFVAIKKNRQADQIKEEIESKQQALDAAGIAASEALNKQVAEAEEAERKKTEAYIEETDKRVQASMEAYEQEKQQAEELATFLGGLNRSRSAAADAAASANDVIREAERKASEERLEQSRIEHAERMKNAQIEHQNMLRLQAEFISKLRGDFDFLRGLRRLEEMPGLLQKMNSK